MKVRAKGHTKIQSLVAGLRRARTVITTAITIFVTVWGTNGTAFAVFQVPAPDPPSSQADIDSYQTDSVWYDPTACGAAVISTAGTGITDTGGDTSLQLNGNQVRNAKTIIGIAKTENLAKRGAIIGLMTAIVESHITNETNTSAVPLSQGLGDPVNGGDHDSVGVFQQRPSTGWSTYEGNATNNPTAIKQMMVVALSLIHI